MPRLCVFPLLNYKLGHELSAVDVTVLVMSEVTRSYFGGY